MHRNDAIAALTRNAKAVQDMGATRLALKNAVHVADVDNGTHYMPSSSDMLPESVL